MHDPDLIIRTSGEQRLSNYLLWQSAYAELIFREELWPDFSRDALVQSLDEFSRGAGASARGERVDGQQSEHSRRAQPASSPRRSERATAARTARAPRPSTQRLRRRRARTCGHA